MYTKYGNCIDCQQYSSIDIDGRCPICDSREKELLLTAQNEIKNNPKLTRDDLAELLHLEISRVEGWIKSGKIRCNALKSLCPNCNSEMNSFSCGVCKYNTAEELKTHYETLPKKTPSKMHTPKAKRTKRKSKRSSSIRNF